MTEWIENFFSKHCINLATDQLIATTEAIYNNIEVQVKVNGNMSKSFLIEKGVRQGCSFLMILYIILAEVMIENIGQNNQIKGITVLQRSKFQLSQTTQPSIYATIALFYTYKMSYELFASVKYNRTSALVCG